MEINCLAMLGQAHLAAGQPEAALASTQRAAEIHEAHGAGAMEDMDAPMLWWQHHRALAANGKAAAASRALARAYRLMVEPIAHLSDAGLRRNYLNKIDVHREIVAAWLAAKVPARGKPPRIPHLAGETSLREPFERLVDTGLRLNELRSAAELHEFLIDEATELSGAERVLLVLESPQELTLAGSLVPADEDAPALVDAVSPALQDVRRTRAASLSFNPETGNTLQQRSRIVAPLVAQNALLGYLYADIDGAYGRFHDADRDLLAMLASQAAVALDNAQWSQGLEQKVAERTEELQASNALIGQRAAELAIINSVQEGLASKLDMQAIYELVGEKLGEVLHSQDIDIRLYDPATQQVFFPYLKDRGQRISAPPVPLGGVSKVVIESGQTWLVNEGIERRMAEIGSFSIPGTQMEKSFIAVPIVAGGRVVGLVGVGDYEREHAFDESSVRLLQTVVSAMSVALENARLFDETQRLLKETEQRAAELAVINSIQEGMAAELDFQAIVDLVGDKLREVFATGDIGIRWHDPATDLMHYLYEYEHGVRMATAPIPPARGGIWETLLQTRVPLVANSQAHADTVKVIPGSDASLSFVAVPILGGDRMLGTIVLENYERENAFGESEVRLLSTVAASMGVALENARLFDETQRLFKQSEQRTAELAIVNSVQAALASKLEIEAIYSLVGDKIREVFAADTAFISFHDAANDLLVQPYYADRSSRRGITSRPYATGGLGKVIIDSGRPLLLGSVAEKERLGRFPIASPDAARDLNESFLGVPLLRDGKAYGAVSVQSYQRDAYGEDHLRLLGTLANSMAVALENAHLFDETQRLLKETEQRAAELAVINSIQEGMAAELDFQAIVDLVGDKLRRVLNTDDIGIRWFDHDAQVIHFLYEYEHGLRLDVPSRPPLQGDWDGLVSNREPIVRNTEKEMAAMGTLPGTDMAKCSVQVPIIGSDRVIGRIIVENHEREHAYGESDVRLLTTVAASMGVALENARLFDETQRLLKETEQRAAELALINSIQEGMAAELDFQAIIDLVGDKLREVFKTSDIGIRWHDTKSGHIEYLFEYDHGVRIHPESKPPVPGGPWEHMVETRQPIVANSLADRARLGLHVLPGTSTALSHVLVPILAGDRRSA